MAASSYYATTTELQERTTRTFSGTTVITSTQIGVLLDQISAQLDGLLGRAEGDLGDSDTVPEWAKQAVLAAAKAVVDSIYQSGEPISEQDILAILRSAIEKNDAYPNTRIFYDQQRPNASGNWN